MPSSVTHSIISMCLHSRVKTLASHFQWGFLHVSNIGLEHKSTIVYINSSLCKWAKKAYS